MKEEFLRLQQEIKYLACAENILCVLVYGTIVNDSSTANDLDIIIVVKNVDSTLNELFKVLSKKYKNLDFNVYSQEEILNDLSFFTREFKLEYLAKGLCVYGENLFKKEFLKVTLYEYKQSILIRSIEYLQIVRQKYFSTALNSKEKLYFLEKYFLRISKSILLFKKVDNHSSVNSLNKDEIFKKLITIGVFDLLPDINNVKSIDEYFNLFYILSEALIKCKKEFSI